MEGHRFCLAKQKRRYHRHNYSVEVGILFYFRAVLNFEKQRLGKIISDETAICLKIFTDCFSCTKQFFFSSFEGYTFSSSHNLSTSSLTSFRTSIRRRFTKKGLPNCAPSAPLRGRFSNARFRISCFSRLPTGLKTQEDHGKSENTRTTRIANLLVSEAT